MLSMAERCAAYKAKFGVKYPMSVPWVGREQGRDVLYAIWLIGNDYRNKTLYHGAYPRGYIERIMALFPDVKPSRTSVLHAFSGSLRAGPYTRCDLRRPAEIRDSIYNIGTHFSGTLYQPRPFTLALADPEYTAKDAEIYGTPRTNRLRATIALARVVKGGGHLVWLDTQWPMHSKYWWVTVGRIFIQRSTQHVVRVATIFRRV